MKKRFLSILLAVILVVSLFPVTALADAHSHSYINGLCECGACEGTHSSYTWTEINSLAKLKELFGTGGYGYLTADITLTENENLEISYADAPVNLCLNGRVLNLNGKGCIYVDLGRTFNLYDCGTSEHKFTVDSTTGLWSLNTEGTKTVTGGVITGGKMGVYLINNSNFTMNGGNICGNAALFVGGGVSAEANTNFTMNGGNICGNIAPINGGGVNAAGNFTMNGGTISDNTAGEIGGGVYVYGPLTIGGTAVIKNNTGHTSANAVPSDAEFADDCEGPVAISSTVAPAAEMNVGLLGKKGDKVLGATSDDEQYFFSNDNTLEVKFNNAGTPGETNDDYLELVEKETEPEPETEKRSYTTVTIGGNKDKEETKVEEKTEENPDTGAPVLSMSTGIAVLFGAAFILSKKK